MSRPDAEEPAPRRPTGLGWPGAPTPPVPDPEPAPTQDALPKPAPLPSQRRELGAERDVTVELPRQPAGSEFARRMQDYRATPTPASPVRRPFTPPDRPGTVTAAAVILFVGAGLGLLACCGLNVLAGESTLGDDEQSLLMLFSAIIVIFSALNGVLGYYVLQGRQWARVTTIVLCVIGIITSIVSLVATAGSGGSNGASTCVGIALNGLIIGLLSGSSATEYFRYARG